MLTTSDNQIKWSPMTTVIGDHYKEALADNIFNESPIMSLLERRVRQAEKDLVKRLNQELFWGSKAGGHDVNLRDSIEDAMDKHWEPIKKQEFPATTRKAETMSTYTTATGESVFGAQPTYKAARKLEQKRAKRVLNDILPAFTNVKRKRPVVIEIVFPTNVELTYRWAAIQGDYGSWYITKNNAEFKTNIEIAAHFTDMAMRASKVKINGSKIDIS